jgi:hypothetical protein
MKRETNNVTSCEDCLLRWTDNKGRSFCNKSGINVTASVMANDLDEDCPLNKKVFVIKLKTTIY